jgi:hypothetical protein
LFSKAKKSISKQGKKRKLIMREHRRKELTAVLDSSLGDDDILLEKTSKQQVTAG